MDKSENNCELAIEILQKTNDGNNLDPQNLKLIECAVKGFLTDAGKQVFMELHQNIMNGTYKKPFLHNIEHLTIDHTGYVFWKDIEIEHYRLGWAYSAEARQKALELARRCMFLENIGVEVTIKNVIWDWNRR